jgi:hypothetical protein
MGLSAPQQPAVQDDSSQPISGRNVLTTAVPPLAGLSAGSEFEFTLNAQLVEELKQGCGRILYDASAAVPVSVEKGRLVPGSFVFFSKLDAEGVIPFAFTALPSQRGIPPGSGELLRERFRLLQPPQPGFKIR